MPLKRSAMRTAKATLPHRASVSFPPELYRALEELAQRKKVSLAWVVRDAAESYVAAESPIGEDGKSRTLRAAKKFTRRTEA